MFYEFNTPLERFRVDDHNGIIYGVSIITAGVTARGHDLEVDMKTLRQMKECAEKNGQVPVKWNHRSGADAVAGYLKNFRIEGKKLKGDWHLLKSHERYNHALELAREMPSCVGLSAAFTGDDDPIAGSKKKLARCDELISVDLVASPAANPDGMLERGDFSPVPGDEEWEKVVIHFDAGVDDGSRDAMNVSQNNGGSGGIEQVLAQLKTLNDNISSLGDRLSAVEQFSGQVNEFLNKQSEEDGDGEGISLQEALMCSPEQIAELHAQGILTDEDVDYISDIHAQADADAEAQAQYEAGEGSEGGLAEAATASSGTALASVQRQVKELSARLHAKELAEEANEYDTLLSTIEGNMLEMAAQNEDLSTQLEATRHALRTSGARALRPAHGARLFEEKVGKKNEFEARVSQHVASGKKRGEAVLLAAKEDPDSYAKYLSGRGLVAAEEEN